MIVGRPCEGSVHFLIDTMLGNRRNVGTKQSHFLSAVLSPGRSSTPSNNLALGFYSNTLPHSAGRAPRPRRFTDRDTHPSGGAALEEEYGGSTAVIFEVTSRHRLSSAEEKLKLGVICEGTGEREKL